MIKGSENSIFTNPKLLIVILFHVGYKIEVKGFDELLISLIISDFDFKNSID